MDFKALPRQAWTTKWDEEVGEAFCKIFFNSILGKVIFRKRKRKVAFLGILFSGGNFSFSNFWMHHQRQPRHIYIIRLIDVLRDRHRSLYCTEKS